VDAGTRITIDERVRDYLTDKVNLRMINPVLALPFRPLLRFLTVGFLAPVFREAMACSGAISNSANSSGCSAWWRSSTVCADGFAITERWCDAMTRLREARQGAL
jgi:uncharacterized protein (DUF2236 family)